MTLAEGGSMKTFGWIGLVLIMALGTGMAFQDEAAPADPAATAAGETGGDEGKSKIPGGLRGILTGMLGGLMAVFIGWGKNKNSGTGEMEKFDIKYAWPTLIIGAVVGLIAHFMDLTPSGMIEAFETSPIFAGAVFALEAVWKMIFRHTAPLIRESVDAIKGAGKNPPSAPPPAQ